MKYLKRSNWIVSVKCHDNGRDYNIGESFLSSDGCNECVCTVNGAACTKISCGGAGVVNIRNIIIKFIVKLLSICFKHNYDNRDNVK